jgi:hypothetical protein
MQLSCNCKCEHAVDLCTWWGRLLIPSVGRNKSLSLKRGYGLLRYLRRQVPIYIPQSTALYKPGSFDPNYHFLLYLPHRVHSSLQRFSDPVQDQQTRLTSTQTCHHVLHSLLGCTLVLDRTISVERTRRLPSASRVYGRHRKIPERVPGHIL